MDDLLLRPKVLELLEKQGKDGMYTKDLKSVLEAEGMYEQNARSQQLNRILYSLQKEGLARRSESNPPWWTIVS